jgi:transcriptional regulator with XRE-family HTH domain
MKNTKDLDLGKWLQNLLEEKEVTYDMVAENIGCDRSTVYRWTQRSDFDIRKLKQVADFLQIDLRNYFENVSHLYDPKRNPKDYQMKYYEILEKYSELQEEYEEYKKVNPSVPGQN